MNQGTKMSLHHGCPSAGVARGCPAPLSPISQAWIPYRAGGCRPQARHNHRSQRAGVTWGPRCTAVEG